MTIRWIALYVLGLAWVAVAFNVWVNFRLHRINRDLTSLLERANHLNGESQQLIAQQYHAIKTLTEMFPGSESLIKQLNVKEKVH